MELRGRSVVRLLELILVLKRLFLLWLLGAQFLSICPWKIYDLFMKCLPNRELHSSAFGLNLTGGIKGEFFVEWEVWIYLVQWSGIPNTSRNTRRFELWVLVAKTCVQNIKSVIHPLQISFVFNLKIKRKIISSHFFFAI